MSHLTNQHGKDSKKLKRNLEKIKLEIKYLESKQDADYVPNIETFVDQDMDLIIGVGYKLEDAITEAAKNYPDNNLQLIDAACRR